MSAPPALKCCQQRTCEPGTTGLRRWGGVEYWAFHQHPDADGLTHYTEARRSHLRRTR